jgi:hypothetical protein
MEIDSQYFWSGAPWDMVARKYVADTLNAGLKVKTFKQTGVIAVSAMEAIGLSSKSGLGFRVQGLGFRVGRGQQQGRGQVHIFLSCTRWSGNAKQLHK